MDVNLINNREALDRFIQLHNYKLYIAQQYIHVQKDFRVLCLKGKICGVAQRTLRITDQTQLKVKYASQSLTTSVPSEILDDCLLLSNHLGLDLAGIDIVLDAKGNYWFIEYNPSPQFKRFAEVTGINVNEEILSILN